MDSHDEDSPKITAAPALRDAVLRAGHKARAGRHRLITATHLLDAMLDDAETRALLDEAGADTARLEGQLAATLAAQAPDAYGPDTAAEAYTEALLRILTRAGSHAQSAGRAEYTPGHVLNAMLAEGQTEAALALDAAGLRAYPLQLVLSRHKAMAPPPPRVSPPLLIATGCGALAVALQHVALIHTPAAVAPIHQAAGDSTRLAMIALTAGTLWLARHAQARGVGVVLILGWLTIALPCLAAAFAGPGSLATLPQGPLALVSAALTAYGLRPARRAHHPQPRRSAP